MTSTGKTIAIASIWLATGFTAIFIDVGVILMAFFAVFATALVMETK